MTLSNQSYASCSAMGVMSGLPSYDTKTTPGSKQWTLCGWPFRLEPRDAHVGDDGLVEGLDGEGRLAGRHVLQDVALGHVLRQVAVGVVHGRVLEVGLRVARSRRSPRDSRRGPRASGNWRRGDAAAARGIAGEPGPAYRSRRAAKSSASASTKVWQLTYAGCLT